MIFQVLIDDNAHYQDKPNPRQYGEYNSYQEAVAVAKSIIDEFLLQNRDQYTQASMLLKIYSIYGEDPYILPLPPLESASIKESFSAMSYARHRCQQLFSESTIEKDKQ